MLLTEVDHMTNRSASRLTLIPDRRWNTLLWTNASTADEIKIQRSQQTNNERSVVFDLLWLIVIASAAHLPVVADESHVFAVRRQVVIGGVSRILAIEGEKNKNVSVVVVLATPFPPPPPLNPPANRVLLAGGTTTDLRSGFGWGARRSFQSARRAGGLSPPTSPGTRDLQRKTHNRLVY